MKWEDFVKDPQRLASLKNGVATMKSRRPSDPTSWFYQGAIHAVTPEAVQAAAAIDAAVVSVDQARFWNQCPHSGQSSADFLLWHRAYIYYFERILRDAASDPALSLPYWNYTEPTRRLFPAEFADDDPDPLTQLPRNPLFDHRREQAFAFGLYQLSEQVAGTGVIFAETTFFGETEDRGLAGGVADINPRTRGLIERQPHDLLHFAIGGAIGTGELPTTGEVSGMMASVQTAAFDPIFWIHHCNIDRLWSIWDCMTIPPRTWGKIPPSEWFTEKPWFFNDVGGAIQNLPRKHYLDRHNLAVVYDSDIPNCAALSATDPSKAGKTAVSVLAQSVKSFVTKSEAGAFAGSIRVSPDDPATTTIPLTQLKEFSNKDVKSVILTASKARPRRLILEVTGIKVEGVTSVGYDVFANVPGGSRPTRESVSYLGTISLFGTDHHHGESADASAGANQRFDITRLVTEPTFDPQKVSVTIVPFDLLVPVNGQPRLRRAATISYRGMRVLVVEGSTSGPTPL